MHVNINGIARCADHRGSVFPRSLIACGFDFDVVVTRADIGKGGRAAIASRGGGVDTAKIRGEFHQRACGQGHAAALAHIDKDGDEGLHGRTRSLRPGAPGKLGDRAIRSDGGQQRKSECSRERRGFAGWVSHFVLPRGKECQILSSEHNNRGRGLGSRCLLVTFVSRTSLVVT